MIYLGRARSATSVNTLTRNVILTVADDTSQLERYAGLGNRQSLPHGEEREEKNGSKSEGERAGKKERKRESR